jgi:SAM-dependent methyltransferase
MSYTSQWYKARKNLSSMSADVIVPILLDSIGQTNSVLDVGCGTGDWLASFRRHGVKNVFGIDGAWVDRSLLSIGPEEFLELDLSAALPELGEFDLVMSSEVAEHIDSQFADQFVDGLARSAKKILFGAATPGQGGTGHVNEQWQSYWKGKFEAIGFVCVDCIRPFVWGNSDVARWYQQNLFLYVQEDILGIHPSLKPFIIGERGIVDVVHPELFRLKTDLSKRSSRELLRALWKRKFG